ncbi:hypothetical protein MBLNU13_g08447t1 [Cladosporium sp. NU13]
MADSSATNTTYFNNPQFSDLTIRLTDDRPVHVHYVILCRSSEYFRMLLAGSFSESGTEDIELVDDDPDAMVEVLRGIYGIAYPSAGAPKGVSWAFHATVYVTAEKYQFEELKQQAIEAMACLVLPEPNTENPWDIVESNPIGDYTIFYTAIRTVFYGTSGTGHPVRLLLARYCLWSASVLMSMEDFKNLLRELPDLAVLLLERQMVIPNPSRCRQYIILSVHDCTGQAVADGRMSLIATPNDYVRVARKLTTSRIETESFEMSLPRKQVWTLNNSNKFDKLEKHQLDKTCAEVSQNLVMS